MKKGVMLGLATIILVLYVAGFIGIVSAADVGYILINKRSANKQVTDVFSSLNLTYDLIEDSKINSVYRTGNLSKYKFLFVDDVRLNNAKNLPVYSYSSIIMNKYYGYEWGLTDRDGIAQMSSFSPLNTKLPDDGRVQVYTEAKYELGSSNIPFYYLPDENKADFTSIGRAFEGGNSNGDGAIASEYGDVIAYAEKGTLLKNNKVSNKICYFGVSKTLYWTDDAKDLFLDCIGFVGVTCRNNSECKSETASSKYCLQNRVFQDMRLFSCENAGTVQSQCVDNIAPVNLENCTGKTVCLGGLCRNVTCMTDSDCNDNNDYTKDTCMNPGTMASFCKHDNIACANDLDCGTNGWLGNPFCVNNKNLTQKYVAFICNNPGAISSACSNTTTNQLLQTCSDICDAGMCKDITCYRDSDCNDNNNQTEDRCLNPGTYSSTCSHQPITCFKNSDCGTNGFTGSNYCIGKNVTRNYVSFMCNNPGTSSSSCTSSTTALLNQTCSDACVGGQCVSFNCSTDSDCNDGNLWTEDKCVNPSTPQSNCIHNPIKCFGSVDCGVNSLSGVTCSGKNVVKNYLNFTCNNPGTSGSSCSNFSGSYTQETCAQKCQAGQCVVYTCSSNSDCADANDRTFDECVNPGTTASFCRNTEVNCLNSNDCGFTGFSGSEYCMENNLFKNFQNSICSNPGTLSSSCNLNISSRFLQDCGSDYCGNYSNYCKGNDVYKIRTCLDRGCLQGSCFNNAYSEESLLNHCSHGCVNGNCLPECTVNSDCGSSSSVISCSGNFLVNTTSIPSCLSGSCANSVTNSSVLCPFGCSQNACLQGVHDVALVDFTESTGGIKITNNSGYVISSSTPLLCNNKYKFIIKSKNLGNFTENVSYSANVGGLSLSYGNSLLAPGGDSGEKVNTITVTLDAGTYNVAASALIAIDNNLANNVAGRQISVICPQPVINCTQTSNCSVGTTTPIFFCKGSSERWVNSSSVMCFNANTTYSYCGMNPTSNFVENCPYGCSAGSCIINCHNNAQCGTDGFTSGLFCSNSFNLSRNFTSFACNSPGTKNSYCSSATISLINQTCSDACLNGACVDIKCKQNSDCGINGFVGSNFCTGLNVTRNFLSFTCNNPGMANSYCSNSSSVRVNSSCSDACSNGACVQIKCKQNSDCGINGWMNMQFCSSNNLFDYYKSYTCNNAGTILSSCSLNNNSIIKQNCGNSTTGSWGNNYCKSNNVYHNRSNVLRGCSGSLCFANNAVEEALVQNCPDYCSNGMCRNFICHNDADCNDGNVRTEDRCLLPGTVSSSCTHNPITCFNNGECGINGFTGNNYCSGKNLTRNYISFNCNNAGTALSYCSNSSSVRVNQTCSDYCSSGSCGVFKCHNNLECGNPFYGGLFCTSSNVTRNLTTPVCNSPNTILSSCVNITSLVLNKTCSFSCYDGACYNFTEFDFGGMYGLTPGAPYKNPATGGFNCSLGYTDLQILGSTGTDYPIHLCYKNHVPGSYGVLDFGGMYGGSASSVWGYKNPATNGANCSSGYTYAQVSGLYNIDLPVRFCYKNHTLGSSGVLNLGGMYGGSAWGVWGYKNPATGAASCPLGYNNVSVHGQNSLGPYPGDFPIVLCYKIS